MNYKQLSFDDIPGLKEIFDNFEEIFDNFDIKVEIDETPTKGDLNLSNDELEAPLTTHDRDICLEEIKHKLAHNVINFLDDPDKLLKAVHALVLFKEANV